MRIPGWLVLIFGLVMFIGMTMLCSVLSYTTTRSLVIDARDSGVDVPSVGGLVDYVLYGVDESVNTLSPEDIIAARPTSTITSIPTETLTPTITPTPPPGVTYTPIPTETPAPSEVPDPMTSLVITDPRRITVLLMGIDQRRAMGYEEVSYRTDTMILTQIDPIRRTIGVLSIPRDLYVTIPGFNMGRINIANDLGDRNALPGGGPQLAMDTVRANLGVPVDKYVRINFEVFTTVVNTISPDGIEVCIDEMIHDDHYPDEGTGFIVVHFDPGCQKLDAERLLQYARTRATFGGDFDRNRRQQEVLKAIQAEVLNLGGIAHFISQIPVLYEQLAGSYKTNLSLEEILQLAQLVGTIPQENMTFRQISNLHVDMVTVDGPEGPQQVLIPVQNQVRFVVQDAFNPQPNLSMADLRQRAESEKAQIVVYNNTTITGLAAGVRDWFTSQGVSIHQIGSIDPPEHTAPITIRDYTGNPWTARYLAALMGLPDSAIRPGTDGITSADVMVVLGTDTEAFLAGQGR